MTKLREKGNFVMTFLNLLGLPENFLPADTEKVSVVVLGVEEDGGAQRDAHSGHRRDQHLPHLGGNYEFDG